MNRLRPKLTYSNVISTLCLVLLVGGGTAYAASEMLPKNSVGSKQIKKAAVTPAKLSAASKATLTGPTGPTGATGPQGKEGPRGPEGLQGREGLQGPSGIAAAYADVESNGTVNAAKSLGVTEANVTHPATGVYCFGGLPFTVRSAMANAVQLNLALGARALPVVLAEEQALPCPAGQTRVETFNTTNNVDTNTQFIVWFEE